MIKTSVTLKNLDSVIKHLKKFEDEKLIQRALGAGLTKAAKPARQSLESKTPIDEHILAKTISHRTLGKRQKREIGLGDGERAIRIGFLKKTMDYRIRRIEKNITLEGLAGILQGGAKKHDIFPRKKGGKLHLADGRIVDSVTPHPGVKPRHIFTKAQQSIGDILTPFYQGMSAYLKKKDLIE